MTRTKNPIAKALRQDPQFRQQKHKSRKEVIKKQQEKEANDEIKDYLNGD